jgi:hypothetical protein
VGKAAVIGNHGWREETGYLEPAVTIRRPHHGNLDPHARNPVTASTGARPSSLRPGSVKNSVAASMSSTTMPTVSMRVQVECGSDRKRERGGGQRFAASHG